METPPAAPWIFAARAAYFGDAVCLFCDHRNPGGAKFCSDCGSPLDLKPCKQCEAVNSQAATNCYKCGAEFPVLLSPSEVMPVAPAADPAPAWPPPGEAGVAATMTQPISVAPVVGAGWRLTVLATLLIAGAYAVYRINAATPDAMEVVSQPLGASEHNAPAPAAPVAVESKPVDPETTAVLTAPVAAINPEAPKRASARQQPVPVPAKHASVRQSPAPVPATKRASARQTPVSEQRAPERATSPVTRTLAAASGGAPDAKTRKAGRPDQWQAMHVSLARCDGDLFARIACDQRVRRRFCEGHWGEAPECASGIANDHGQ